MTSKYDENLTNYGLKAILVMPVIESATTDDSLEEECEIDLIRPKPSLGFSAIRRILKWHLTSSKTMDLNVIISAIKVQSKFLTNDKVKVLVEYLFRETSMDFL